MDRGAWRATVHGVTKNQTRLSHKHVHILVFIQRVAQQNIKSVPFFLNSRYTFDKGTKSATTGYLHPNNMNLDTDFPSIIKVNSKWITDLNVKSVQFSCSVVPDSS